MKLYKYSPINENSLAGLINSQLWFSDPRSFNDPFDSDFRMFKKSMEEDYRKEIEKHRKPLCERFENFEKTIIETEKYIANVEESITEFDKDISEFDKDISELDKKTTEYYKKTTEYYKKNAERNKVKCMKLRLNLEISSNELKNMKQQQFEIEQKATKFFTNKLNERINGVFETVGALCLTTNKGESNTLMWSHYADSHKGFILEFDTDKEEKENKFFSIVNIKYSTNDINQFDEETKKAIPEERMVVELITKAKQWEYEQEVRIIKVDIKNNQRLLKYDPKCLTGIYFGLKTTEEHKETIKQIIQLKGLTDIKLYQAEKVEGSFNLVYTEI